MQIIRYLKAFYLSLISAIVIIILSLIPINAENTGGLFEFKNADKIVHTALYMWLTFMLLYEIAKYKKGRLPLLLIPVLIAFIYGGTIEILQIFQPGRSGEILDWLADLIGSILAIPFYLFFRKFISNKNI